jgi:hypothetical protein
LQSATIVSARINRTLALSRRTAGKKKPSARIMAAENAAADKGEEADAPVPLQQVQLHRGHGTVPLLVCPAAANIARLLGLRPHDREVAWRVSEGIGSGLDQ